MQLVEYYRSIRQRLFWSWVRKWTKQSLNFGSLIRRLWQKAIHDRRVSFHDNMECLGAGLETLSLGIQSRVSIPPPCLKRQLPTKNTTGCWWKRRSARYSLHSILFTSTMMMQYSFFSSLLQGTHWRILLPYERKRRVHILIPLKGISLFSPESTLNKDVVFLVGVKLRHCGC